MADHKVDPAYPSQLMRENVAGTVTLRCDHCAADETVSDIRVVKWRRLTTRSLCQRGPGAVALLPAMKNDANVDVELRSDRFLQADSEEIAVLT